MVARTKKVAAIQMVSTLGDVTANLQKADALVEAACEKGAEVVVLPEFFTRSPEGVPLRWIARITRALATLAWRYNADRMAIDYATRCYLPAVGAPTSEFPAPV